MSLILNFSLLLSLSLVNGLTYKEASSVLRSEVGLYGVQGQFGKELCDNYNCCEAKNNNCNLNNMPKDETTLYLPGGDSRCIFSTSTPYAAQVIPGQTDKLLVFFQGVSFF